MRFINSILSILKFNKRNWKAVTLCVLAASVFWIFNALNKDYTTNVSFPISFDYNIGSYVPIRPLPEDVQINVTGMGWDLFRTTLGWRISPLIIPLERPAEIKKIVTAPALFASQLEEYKINYILTDTFRIALEPKTSRWISVRADTASMLIRQNYAIVSAIEVTPDSVFIEGPLELVRSLQEPIYVKLSQRNIDEDFQDDIEVKFLNDELIKRDPPTVQVRFAVDELVAVKDSVRLQLVNFPKGANPYYGVSKVRASFLIPERSLDRYDPDSTIAVLDLSEFEKGVKRIRPEVAGLPPYSRVTDIDSVFVKF